MKSYKYIGIMLFVIGSVLLFSDSNNLIIVTLVKLVSFGLVWSGGWLLGKS